MPKYAPRTSTKAIAAAKAYVGKRFKPGWCQAFVVVNVFGTGGVGDWDGDRAADAEDGWKAAVAQGRVVSARQIASYDDIPAGVPLYWLGGSRDNGHAATSAGGGDCYSTDLPNYGYVGRVPITEVNRRWGLTFAGYVIVTGNGYTVTDPPAPPVDRMDPANYGPGKVGDHITWYGNRLVLHGFGRRYKTGPGPTWGPADGLNTRDCQLARGFTGVDANGLPGLNTLRFLASDPKPAKP
jgi:hypothetical protein